MLYTAASQFQRCKDNISPNRSSFLFIGTKALVVIWEGEFERGKGEDGRRKSVWTSQVYNMFSLK